MGYVAKTLAPEEDYLYRAHFNWTYDFRSWFWFAFGLSPIILWVGAYGVTGAAPGFGATFLAFAALALFSGVVILFARYVHRWVTVIAVTSLRLVFKTGLISRDTHEVTLDKVEEVLVHQTFLGRILGYGQLTIRGTGIAIIELPVLGEPVRIRREIETAIAAARAKTAGATSTI